MSRSGVFSCRVVRWVEHAFPFLLLVMGLVLLLPNLGNIYLWQDEAETALLSQRLGMYGLPMAFDGRNLIRQAPMDVQYTADYVWVYHPWLPFYWTALSFALLGPTTFAARLPYALAGVSTALLLYCSVRRHFRDHRVAMLSATFLLLCVPFLLHTRQCKYFPFAALFTVAAIDAYLRLSGCSGMLPAAGIGLSDQGCSQDRAERDPSERWVVPYFVLSGFCLFQSNFGAFLPLLAALGLHAVGSRFARPVLKRLILAAGLLLFLVVPWAIYLQTWERGRFFFDVYRFVGHLVHYGVYITGWVLPLPILLLFLCLFVRCKKGFVSDARERSTVILFGLVIVTTILFLSATFIWMYFSYIVQLVPLLAVVLALAVLRIWDRSRVLGLVVLFVLVTTNVLHLFPYALPAVQSFKWASLAPRRYLAETDELIALAGRVRLDLAHYAYELTHDYDGPDEGIVLFLQANAAPDDTVLTNYGELPIAFYTGLCTAGGLSAYRVGEIQRPEWVINRRDGPYASVLAQIISQGPYEGTEIPYADILWGNRPVPEYHKYATVQGVPKVIIHRRVQ